MSILAHIAEQRIRAALERGELDDLPGRGQPLPPDEFAHLPEELRMAHRVLKNAGVAPEGVQVERDLAQLREQLELAKDPERQRALSRRIQALLLARELLRERRRRR